MMQHDPFKADHVALLKPRGGLPFHPEGKPQPWPPADTAWAAPPLPSPPLPDSPSPVFSSSLPASSLLPEATSTPARLLLPQLFTRNGLRMSLWLPSVKSRFQPGLSWLCKIAAACQPFSSCHPRSPFPLHPFPVILAHLLCFLVIVCRSTIESKFSKDRGLEQCLAYTVKFVQ